MTDEVRRSRQREGTRKYREKRFREIDAMPKIPCECGCGTMLAPINKTLQPARFAHGHNEAHAFKAAQFKKGQRLGPLAHNWRGGKKAHHSGYVMLLVDGDHPMATKRGYVLAHRLVMSDAIGRPLRTDEQVHHINGDRGDNRLENLQLMQRFHGTGGAYRCCECGSNNIEPTNIRQEG